MNTKKESTSEKSKQVKKKSSMLEKCVGTLIANLKRKLSLFGSSF